MATSTDTDDKKSGGLKENSLKAAGWAYLVGDAGMFVAHAVEKDSFGLWTGPIWAAGSFAVARYGNPKAEKQLELLNQRLGDYLKKQGIEIPKNPTTAALTKRGGVIDHIESFLYAHPSEALNATYALGAGLLAAGGIKKGVKSDIGSGVLVAAGALAGLLIPERAPDPGHPPHGAMEKTWAWVQEKPLRASGILYHLNNICSMVSIYEKFRHNRAHPPENKMAMGSPYFRAVTAASFIFANTMLALSSKGHGGGKEHNGEITATLADESAQVIAAQPKELREALVYQIAGYLASQPQIGKSAADIAGLLHAKLAAIQPLAPAGNASWQQRIASGSPSLSPSV